MSTENIFGSWDSFPRTGDHLATLWHQLAAQNVGTAEFIPNFGLSQRRAEITMLWSLFERQKPDVTLEIGVAQGGTFASWCVLGHNYATIIGIDRDCNDCRPRPGEQVNPLIWPEANAMTSGGGGLHLLRKKNQSVHAINGWSHEPETISQLKSILDGRKIDFLSHDASHEATMAKIDYGLYRPFMAEGSIMAFHDVMPSRAKDCNKSEFWEWVKTHEEYSACFEFFSSRNDDSMGWGVIIL